MISHFFIGRDRCLAYRMLNLKEREMDGTGEGWQKGEAEIYPDEDGCEAYMPYDGAAADA